MISVNVRSALPKDLPEEALLALKYPGDKYTFPATAAPAVGPNTDGTASVDMHNDTGNASSDSAVKEPPRKKSKKGNNSNPNNSSNNHDGPAKAKVITEMDYVTMLNRSLPDDIRVLGWCEVTPEFSARFSASDRKYRYFFQKKNLNIAAMQEAASYLLGNHDFRNICKMDIANVSNFKREIYSAEIKRFQPDVYDTLLNGGSGVITHTKDNSDMEVVNNASTSPANPDNNAKTSNSSSSEEEDSNSSDVMYMLEIKGIAFLWHMVRCIMSVLFMVGEGLEQPTVVQRLLDVAACPGKPPYPMAPENALVLHQCGFDHLRIHMQCRHLWQLTAHYRTILEAHLVSAARARNSLEFVMKSVVRAADVSDFIEELLQKDQAHAKRVGYKAKTTAAGKWN